MEILLNDNLLSVEGIDNEITVAQLLDTVEASLKGSGTTIIDITIDGAAYSPYDTDKLSNMKLLSYQKIELFTATLQEVVKAAFDDTEVCIQHVESLALEIAGELRIGNVKDAMNKLTDFIDGIEWLLTMLKSADLVFVDNMTENSLLNERKNLVSRLIEQTRQIQLSQESRDWVALADALEYEFPDILLASKEVVGDILKN